MNEIKDKIVQTYQKEGLMSVINWGSRWFMWKVGFDSIYQRLLPEVITVNIGLSEVKFYTTAASIFYDFRNDVRTERPVIKDVVNSVEPDDILYDIGANVGIYSVILADELNSGNVVAFEPDPVVATELERNANLTNIDVEIRKIALSDKAGTVPLVRNAPTTSQIKSETDSAAATNVKTLRGDDIDDLPNPSVLKIDVEGAELSVINGLEETLRDRSCKLVYCEVHDAKNKLDDSGVVESILEKLGFECECILRRREQRFLRGEKECSVE